MGGGPGRSWASGHMHEGPEETEVSGHMGERPEGTGLPAISRLRRLSWAFGLQLGSLRVSCGMPERMESSRWVERKKAPILQSYEESNAMSLIWNL